MTSITTYPLSWPAGWNRAATRMARSRFKNNTLFRARCNIESELKRLGAVDVILSSNVPIRIDGSFRLNYARDRQQDPGVAVYFVLRGKQMVMARDAFATEEDNLHSLYLTVAHLRGLERHGGAVMMEKAFTGFTALPAPGDERRRTWRQVLKWNQGRDPYEPELKIMYRELATEKHPDRGGSQDLMVELNAAYQIARIELGFRE